MILAAYRYLIAVRLLTDGDSGPDKRFSPTFLIETGKYFGNYIYICSEIILNCILDGNHTDWWGNLDSIAHRGSHQLLAVNKLACNQTNCTPKHPTRLYPDRKNLSFFDLHLGNVTKSLIIVRTITFDKWVVIGGTNGDGVLNGGSTARLSAYIPLILICRYPPFYK